MLVSVIVFNIAQPDCHQVFFSGLPQEFTMRFYPKRENDKNIHVDSECSVIQILCSMKFTAERVK
jgi:hypothetical protein